MRTNIAMTDSQQTLDAYFFMGTNGSGKSTIRDYVSIPKYFIIIDPDLIAKTNNMNELQAGREAIRIYEDCLDNRKSFAMETTLSGVSSVKRIERAKKEGFSVSGYFIGLEDVEINIKRVEIRVEKGGHDIPQDKIIKRFDESRDNLVKVSPFFDKLEIIDNSKKFDLGLRFENQKLIFKNEKALDWIHSINNRIESRISEFTFSQAKENYLMMKSNSSKRDQTKLQFLENKILALAKGQDENTSQKILTEFYEKTQSFVKDNRLELPKEHFQQFSTQDLDRSPDIER